MGWFDEVKKALNPLESAGAGLKAVKKGAKSLAGKKGEDPTVKAERGLALLPDMEKRLLNDSNLMQGLARNQMRDVKGFEDRASKVALEGSQSDNQEVTTAANRARAEIKQQIQNSGLTGLISNAAIESFVTQRAARDRRRLAQGRSTQLLAAREVGLRARGAAREGLIGVRQNIQSVKKNVDNNRLNLVVRNTLPGSETLLKGPEQGLLGTVLGAAGFALSGGNPQVAQAGYQIGNSLGSYLAE
jgi:hypothetical protein